MEIPEKIYLHPTRIGTLQDVWYLEKVEGFELVEYTRTDTLEDLLESAESHAYFAGSESMREKLINKACNWLQEHLQDYAGFDSCKNQVPFDEQIFTDFKKAIEEE